jgi:hypothetical protein
MQTSKIKWDVERAAAWLRKYSWGARGEDPAPQRAALAEAQAQTEIQTQIQAQAHTPAPSPAEPGEPGEDEEIDIAGWPALVAPFYD